MIGGGVVGLYLAWKLSEKGHKVTLFEKKDKIGKEACSGLFSERILDFIPQCKSLIQNQIESVLIHFPKKTLNVKFSQRFLVMSHVELDKLVFNLAQKAGADIKLQSPINSLPQGFDRTIGCDGANSAVRKSLGLAAPVCRLGIQGFVSERNSASFVETWPVKGGFIWKIPRGRKSMKFPSSPSSLSLRESSITEYGIISSLKGAKLLFEEFLNKNNIKLEKINSAFVPQGFLIPRNSAITLCGDAAGLTKPWSGGGVVWGLTAAAILLKNFPDFIKYQKDLKKFFGPKILISKIATRVAYLIGFHFPWILPKNVKIEGDVILSNFTKLSKKNK